MKEVALVQLKGVENVFTTLYYELTWAVGWEQIISFIDAIIKSDFSNGEIQSAAIGRTAGANSVDVTKELKEKENKVKETSFSKEESAYIIIAGYSSIMEISMRITIWNQLNRFMLQIMGDTKTEKYGEHCYDKYVDSIEIRGHIDFAVTKAKEECS